MMSLPLPLWSRTLREMFLCHSSLFYCTPAQHGCSGIREGNCVCGLPSRSKSCRPTGGRRPAGKGGRERSTLGTEAVTQRAPTRWQGSGGGVSIRTKYSYFHSIEKKKKKFTTVFMQIKYLKPLFPLFAFFFFFP